MTQEEKTRLEHYKSLGTLHRDQLDDYYHLRVLDEGLVEGVRMEVQEMPEPQVVEPVMPVVEAIEVTPEKVTVNEETTEASIMEKLQTEAGGGEKNT